MQPHLLDLQSCRGTQRTRYGQAVGTQGEKISAHLYVTFFSRCRLFQYRQSLIKSQLICNQPATKTMSICDWMKIVWSSTPGKCIAKALRLSRSRALLNKEGST